MLGVLAGSRETLGLVTTVSVSQYRASRAGVQEVGLHRATMAL